MRKYLVASSLAVLLVFCAGAAEPRWIRITSQDFEMYSTAGERSAKDSFGYFEQVRSFFLQTTPSVLAESSRVRIVAFNSMKEYEPYRIGEVAVAYYQSSGAHDYIVLSRTGAETFPTAVHEYVHLVQRHAHMNLPPWLAEGMAELYSTLKPIGDKILVGSLIPGRHQALLADKWVPLSVIVEAGHDSPYYNEKARASALYNEGWALTHMLALSPGYHSGYAQVVRAITDGRPSTAALEGIYKKPLSEIEKDLRNYLRGERFQGALIPAKLEKSATDLSAEPVSSYDAQLMLCEIGPLEVRWTETRKTLERLIAESPARPEAHAVLGYLEWRSGHNDSAREHLSKAYDLGDRDSQLLFDLVRLLDSSDLAKSTDLLKQLIKQQPHRVDARLELGSLQLRADAPKDALETLAPIKKVTREEAPQFFTLLAYANVQAHDRKSARDAAVRLRELANGPDEQSRAETLLKYIDQYGENAQVAQEQLPADSPGHPTLAHRDLPPPPAPVARPAFAGTFVTLDCATPAVIVVATPQGKKRLVIDDPKQVRIDGSGATRDLTCGPQKPTQIRVEYDPPPATRTGVDGIVRAIYFTE